MKVDFEAIKAATDMVSVMAGYGMKFKKAGRDYVALCPFHSERTPSFHVTPARGLFHCFGCEAKGNVIQFVALKEGVSEREAAIRLLRKVPGVSSARALPRKTQKGRMETEPKKSLKPGESADLLQRVVSFYAKTLAKDRAGRDYLKGRNLVEPALLGSFQIGYSNGSLLKVLPRQGEILEGLKTLGVLRRTGASILKAASLCRSSTARRQEVFAAFTGGVWPMASRNIFTCPVLIEAFGTARAPRPAQHCWLPKLSWTAWRCGRRAFIT